MILLLSFHTKVILLSSYNQMTAFGLIKKNVTIQCLPDDPNAMDAAIRNIFGCLNHFNISSWIVFRRGSFQPVKAVHPGGYTLRQLRSSE